MIRIKNAKGQVKLKKKWLSKRLKKSSFKQKQPKKIQKHSKQVIGEEERESVSSDITKCDIGWFEDAKIKQIICSTADPTLWLNLIRKTQAQ